MNFFKLRKLKREIAPILRNGGAGILPTDTLYGIVGSALNKKVIERIYRLRKRNLKKPMIIIISSFEELEKFNIEISKKQKKILKQVWPGKVSVVLECDSDNLEFLHRGTNSLAFRVPAEKWLRKFLKKTGPLVAPSANFEGEPPAKNKEEAREYFGDKIDFYIDLGELESEPSTIIKVDKGGKADILREGAVKIESK